MPTVHPLIRRATHGDAEALAELAATSFRDAYRLLDDPREIDEYVAKHFTPAIFVSILDDPASTLLVTATARHLVGYALIKQAEAPSCVSGPMPIELARLYLRQEVLGRGLGAALMHAAHAEAHRRGGRTLWLAVYDRNQRARDFYRRRGFVDVGTRDFILGGRSYADPVMAMSVRRPETERR